MKKSFVKAAIAMACAAFTFMSCATTESGSKTSSGASAPKSIHPREYTIDLAESAQGSTINVVFNQYGPNYQSDPAMDFSKFVRKDKPQAGDTIHMYYKFSSNIDLPIVRISLIDPTVNYWLELAPDGALEMEDVKAGEIYEGVLDIVLTSDVSSEFKVYIAYDTNDFVSAGYPKVDGPAVFTMMDVEGVETTDVLKELPATEVAAMVGPKTINVDMNKVAAFCDVHTGHPWINGVEDKSQIEDYQADIIISDLLEEPLQAGDKLVLTWRAKADNNIPALRCIPVDRDSSVGWYKELIEERFSDDYVIARDIKKGETFEVSKTIEIMGDSVSTAVMLRLFYDYDKESKGPGTSTIMIARD